MGNYHLTSMFFKTFKGNNTMSVRKADPAYNYLEREYKNEFAKDGNDNLLIRTEIAAIEERKAELLRLKRSIRRITVGSTAYDYFVNEYRQNTPMRDSYGNFVLSDDLVASTRKL